MQKHVIGIAPEHARKASIPSVSHMCEKAFCLLPARKSRLSLSFCHTATSRRVPSGFARGHPREALAPDNANDRGFTLPGCPDIQKKPLYKV